MLIFLIIQIPLIIVSLSAQNLSVIAWVALVQIVSCIIILWKKQQSLLSLAILFLAFSFILHFGQYMLEIMNTSIIPSADIRGYASTDNLLTTGKYCICSHFAVCFGLLLYLSNKKNKAYHISIYAGNDRNRLGRDVVGLLDNPRNRTVIRTIGDILIIVGLLFSLLSTLTLLYYMLKGGYYSSLAHGNRFRGMYSQLANLWEIGVIILFLVNRENITKCKRYLVISLIYLFFSMLTGYRILAMMNATMLLYCYTKIVQRIRFRRSFLFIIIGVIAAQYIVNIGINRIQGVSLSTSTSFSITNLIAEVFAEFGGTAYTVCLVIEYVPKSLPFLFGLTYLVCPIFIFPNFGWNSWSFVNAASYTEYLRQFTNSGIGGSYIGEAYFNAGWFGLILLLLFGIFLGFFESKVNSLIASKKWIQLIPHIATIPYILMLTRSFIKDLVRPYVWTYLVVLFLLQVFKSRTKSN